MLQSINEVLESAVYENNDHGMLVTNNELIEFLKDDEDADCEISIEEINNQLDRIVLEYLKSIGCL